MAGRTPPRFVPTLTEVVQPPSTEAATPRAVTLSEDQLVHRILQRVDMSLDRRIREAIASVILEQSRQLGPKLREEVELAVREAVSQALSEELAAHEAGTGRAG